LEMGIILAWLSRALQKNQGILYFMYLVGDVDKGGLLMVFLEWMMQLWVEYNSVGVEIGPSRRPPLYNSHAQWPASAGLACQLVGVL
jgi:hypothetical protein